MGTARRRAAAQPLSLTSAFCITTAAACLRISARPGAGSSEQPSRAMRKHSTISARCTAPERASAVITCRHTNGSAFVPRRANSRA